MNLWIVTPSARAWNLPALQQSIEANAPLAKWLIYHDAARNLHVENVSSGVIEVVNRTFSAGKGWGHEARNLALDDSLLNEAWIYWLDDDNLLHHDLWKVTSKVIEENPEVRAMVFRQEREDRTEDPIIQTCRTDMGQVLVHREAYGEHRFLRRVREADGAMFEALVRSGVSFLPVPEVCAFYNRLNWRKLPT